MWQSAELHILKIPNFVSGTGALSDALRLSPRTRLVSAGSITPSSHNLRIRYLIIVFAFKDLEFGCVTVLHLALEKYGLPSISNRCTIGSLSAFSSSAVHGFPSLKWRLNLLRCLYLNVSCSLSFFSAPL